MSSTMIVREKYINQLRGFYESDLVKVITGVRRCGKSVVLNQIMDEIKDSTDRIIYLNFENISDKQKVEEYQGILNYVNAIKQADGNKKSTKYYIFLDEVHEVSDWAVQVKSIRLTDSVFITGSNSKLLSNEYMLELSGRFVSFQIHPFVFREANEFCRELNKPLSVSDYLIWGGFPKRFEFSGNDTIKYLEEITNTIIFKDLIARFQIRNTEAFYKVVNFVMRSNSRIVSSNSIYKAIKQNCDVSSKTISVYLDYLKSAYLINSVKQFSTKTKTELNFYEKIYNEDVCFNSLRTHDNDYDLTHNFENAIFNELIFMGYEVKVYRTSNWEIDFFATKDGKSYLVQAAYSIADKKAREREFRPFNSIDNTYKKILITNDDIDFSTSTVSHVPFSKFVFMDDLSEIN